MLPRRKLSLARNLELPGSSHFVETAGTSGSRHRRRGTGSDEHATPGASPITADAAMNSSQTWGFIGAPPPGCCRPVCAADQPAVELVPFVHGGASPESLIVAGGGFPTDRRAMRSGSEPRSGSEG